MIIGQRTHALRHHKIGNTVGHRAAQAPALRQSSNATQAIMLEIDDEPVGLLIEQDDAYHFDATHPALLTWQGHQFASVGEARQTLSRILQRANDQ